MNIIKYFYEEPVLLEALTPNRDPDARQQSGRAAAKERRLMDLDDFLSLPSYHRGYLAGTDLDTGHVGITALSDPAAFVRPLVDALGQGWWGHYTAAGSLEEPDNPSEVLHRPEQTAVLITAAERVEPDGVSEAARGARRYAIKALRHLLDRGATVFFPEPAHDGFDWSFFAAHPMRDALVAAFRQHPAEDTRRFVLPYQKARSESKFYFDTWQLKEQPLPDYIEEV